MKWFVYICQANTGRFYTGISNNPEARVAKHNKGYGSKFARDQGALSLVYVSSAFSSKSEARKREIQIKGWKSDKKQKLINGEWQ